MSPPTLATPGQFLTFRIGGDEYGLPILQVREIIEYQPITRVPNAPPAIIGVLNLRGSAVPVADLSRAFGRPESVITRRTCVVIVEVHHDTELTAVGMLVDSVSQVLELTEAQIRPPPSFGTPVSLDFLRGMGQVEQRFVLLLDCERVLSLDELRGLRAVASSSPAPAQAGTP